MGGGLTSVTDVNRAGTDVGTDVATALGAWSLTSVTMWIGPVPMSVPMWRSALGTKAAIPTSVTDVILAETDVGTDAGADWTAEHR